MNKFIVLSVSLLTFSSSAAQPETSVRYESTQKQTVSTGFSASTRELQSSQKRQLVEKQQIIEKGQSQGQIRVERRKTTLKKRSINAGVNKTTLAKTRLSSPLLSSKASFFEIYDSWVSLDSDYDGDGYYSEFTINFDANYSGGFADVYADIYLSQGGGAWVHIATTDIFTIHSFDSHDYYSVATGLNYNFPTGDYDVLIDLYEAGYSGIVDSVSSDEFSSLYALPLEDDEHELNSNNTRITYVASELVQDRDYDGFFTHLLLEYDIDTINSGRSAYAEVNLTNTHTLQRQLVETTDFIIGNQTELIDLVLEAGYLSGWYDVQIQLIDSLTGQVLANAAQDFSALSRLPVESQDFDYQINYPDTTPDHIDQGHAVVTHESGGGSLGVMLLLIILVTASLKAKELRTRRNLEQE